MPIARSLAVLVSVAVLAGMPTPARAALQLQPGIGLVAVTGVAPNVELVLRDRRGREVQRGTTDRFGSFVFRDLVQGARYVVGTNDPTDATPVTVLDFRDHPDASFYRGQVLHEGFQYIQARDGTLLAAMVRAPLLEHWADGPFPTVVEYSGYATADPDSPQAVTLIASALGFATVAVNMRGSGCSGGMFDLFDLPTTADGYDIIETVGAQSWVKGGVGMVGISFSGISQLFVGGARPPHLGAIAPLSVIADIYRAPGYPGGIFNNGFAATWLQERKDDAAPAPEGGQAWAVKRVNEGDATCLANQRLRLQTQDPVALTRELRFYTPSLMDQRSPINWVKDIEVPMFLSSAWQDEQTGGDFASMLFRVPRRAGVKITVMNGVHSSTLDPEVLWRWHAFLELYVAHQVPDPSFLATVVAPIVYHMILGDGTPTPPLPANRFAGITDYDQALRLFEADPHVRVLMENGAGSAVAGLPAPTFELGFRQWPPEGARPTAWYFGANGTLTRTRPRRGEDGVDTCRPDPDARPAQTIPGQGQSESWEIIPPYDWRPLVDGTGVAYATAPLAKDTTIVGPGSVDLWLRSSAPDTDLQVTLTEVRPDGLETYVQNGWLRASHRRLDRRRSSVLEPRQTHLERDAQPMPDGQFAKVRVGLFASAHVFRQGSRIRIGIEAPGGDRTRWRFDTPSTGGAVLDEIARSAARRSRLVLPVVTDVEAPPALPPCPGLRGQPCRTYVAAANGG